MGSALKRMIAEDCRTGQIVPICKRKDDVQDLGKYRGIMFRNHVMKVWESILEERIRKSVRDGGDDTEMDESAGIRC